MSIPKSQFLKIVHVRVISYPYSADDFIRHPVLLYSSTYFHSNIDMTIVNIY